MKCCEGLPELGPEPLPFGALDEHPCEGVSGMGGRCKSAAVAETIETDSAREAALTRWLVDMDESRGRLMKRTT
jgi:hypothetical protein